MSTELLKPSEDPSWDNNKTNYLAPDTSHINDGFVTDEIPASNLWNGWRNIVAQYIKWLTGETQIVPGGRAPTGVAISSNEIVPTAGTHFLTGSGTINLISLANHNAGRKLELHGTSGQTTVLNNLTGSAAGFAQIQTSDGNSITLLTEQDIVEFRLNAAGNLWRECYRSSSLGPSTTNVQRFEARLTTVTAVAVPTTDETGITTLYLTPYGGGVVGLFDGSIWRPYALAADVALAVPATTSQTYDVFLYLSGGSLTLEAVAWTNDTTRATSLVLQNGALVKNGALTHRYVGSFRTTTSSGQTEDSLLLRYVWNYYNRVERKMAYTATGTTHGQSNGSPWRQSNSDTTRQLDCVVGVVEDVVPVSIQTAAVPTSVAYGSPVQVAVGLNSTTTPTGLWGATMMALTTTDIRPVQLHTRIMPVAGRNVLVWLERCGSGVDVNWYDTDNAGSLTYNAGMAGSVRG